jgi:hypothetical protein
MSPFPALALFGLAAYLNHGNRLFIPAIIVGVLGFWSIGIVANFQHYSLAPRWAQTAASICFPVCLLLILIGVVWERGRPAGRTARSSGAGLRTSRSEATRIRTSGGRWLFVAGRCTMIGG